MANVISLAEKYTGILDQYYKDVAKSSVLELNQSFTREFDSAGSIKLLELALHGAGDYDRGTGFPAGSINSAWRAYTISEDRGVSFNIDAMDSEEGMLMIAEVAKTFMRDFMIPEVDAFRFARIAAKTPVGQIIAANLTTATALGAIDTAMQVLADNEVSPERSVMFMSNTVMNLIKNSDKITRNLTVTDNNGNVSRVPTSIEGIPIITVPANRFVSAIDLNAGGVAGWGYAPAAGSKAINFQLVSLDAASAITRHAKTRLFSADVNQSADADKFDYRMYHDLICPQRKLTGLYTHTVA